MQTIKGTFTHGLKVDESMQKEYELREATVEDMLDAEMEAGVDTPLNFSAQMLVRQLVSIGTFNGPFTIGMIKKLKPMDFRKLRTTQMELDALGEAE